MKWSVKVEDDEKKIENRPVYSRPFSLPVANLGSKY